jgi:acetyl esterase/lipase
MESMSQRFLLILAVCWLVASSISPLVQALPDRPRVVLHRDIAYRPGESKYWRLDLALPADAGDKPLPAIIVIHGGGWLEGDKSSFTLRKHGVPGNIEEFAEAGFAAATINYRLSGEAPFPAAVEDCKCAVRWLRAHAKEYNIDPARIGAYGNSAGGHLALILAMTDKNAGLEGDGPYQSESSRVQAAVSDSGPIDLLGQYQSNRLREVVSRFMGGAPEGDRTTLYEKASPIRLINKETQPLLLIYGVDDEQVPVESADDFVIALRKAGWSDINYYRLAKTGHCPYSIARVAFLKPAVLDFFRRTLIPADPTP